MSYVDGFVAPIKPGVSREEYRDFAGSAAPIFREHGAIRVVEGWQDDVPRGEVTDFYRAVGCEEGETVVFSWIEWPDKATRDAGMKKVMEDPRMPSDVADLPFVGKRMIFGGFDVIVDEKGA